MRKRWISYLCASLMVVTLLAINIGQSTPQTQRQSASLSALPRLGANNSARPQISSAYDEQIACTFTQDMPSLSYTIAAVAQSGTDGYGPAYLVNGLGNTGYWYQVGLSYNWSVGSGFQLSYEVFNPSGNSIFPSDGGGGTATFSPVNKGDSITLSLSFSNGNVIMQGSDQNTGAHTQETYTAAGATTFVGNPSAVANKAGLWTGLMTEWYHSAPYYGDEQTVTYYDNVQAITSAWMWIDEISVSQNGSIRGVFSVSTPSPLVFTNPTQLQTFSSNGATESIDATQFVTGGLSGASSGVSTVAITFGYSISGGTGTSSTPVLTYIAAGAQQTVALTQSNQTFLIDSGTTWSITNPTSSSSSTERWQTSQATMGVATSPQTIEFLFYHQYLVTFSFNIIGGGTGYTTPILTCQQFGVTITPAIGTPVWADSTQYNFPDSLAGSSSSERWINNSASGMISATGTIVATYYHQYYVTANLDPVAGGSVSVESGWFNSGTPFQSVASANSGWQFESWKGSGSGSYSGFGGNASAIVNAPLIETATFYPGLTITPSSKGSVSYSGGAITGSIQTATPGTVFAPQGTTIQLIAKSKLFIYSFAGWTGSSVSSKNTVSIVLNSPLSISANFSYNYVIIWIVSAMVIAAIIILTLLMLRRRRSKRHITRSMSQDEL